MGNGRKFLTTRAGYARAQARLQSALDEFHAVCDTNAEAAGAGDTSVWHDNFAYEENQRQMHQLSLRVSELRRMLGNLQVVGVPPRPSRVQVGCAVSLRDADSGEEWTFTVAGFDDGDPAHGRVSYNSPLMRELLDAEVGEKRVVGMGGQERTIAVVSIVAEECEEMQGG